MLAAVWLPRGATEGCSPLLTAARVSRTAQPSGFCNPTHCSSQPQTQKPGGFLCSCGFARMGVRRGEKNPTLGGLLSTPSDISKAISECCLPGSPGASAVLAVTMHGAQVVPIRTVKSKHLTAASCPRWIPPSQATFFAWPPRALPCARGSGDRQQPDFTRRFFPCSISDRAGVGGGRRWWLFLVLVHVKLMGSM